MKSDKNYQWLVTLGLALCSEYTIRYNKVHALEKTLLLLHDIPNGIPLTARKTRFVQVMPDEYKQNDPVQAYRDYYLFDKVRFAKWKYTEFPYWFTP